ncbi:ABC transporter substrate-binding protein [Pseudomonas sp. C2L12B]|uniref:ABC transporter substrate-binding protein n=2 Tax=Pseudomonas typographi TaxID=2715964 RepID=A0ABR7Z9R4_9PSED|nr:ABC transporter substrate-binding protein [Pseudomonas typographi]MBD1587172.1 ABC transporter substrate-binding protein [Pseudomonas typographi]MBD1602299.1 ABC transporter substrate-binding protein [Pseudomonas typographi]
MFTRPLVYLGCLALLAQAARAEEISVTQWGTSLYGLPFAVAMDKGYFKQAGIDITGILGSGGGGTTVRNILASDTPYGEVALSAALAAQRQGLDLVLVNVGTRSVAEASAVVAKGAPLASVKDLAGKKIAITSPKGVSEMLLLMVLQKEGVDPASVTRVASGGYVNGLTLLDQGAVSAAVLIEPLSITRKADYTTLYRAGDVLEPMTTSVGITTRAFAKAHPEKLKAIIEGRRQAVQFIYQHPEDAAAILAKAFKFDPAIAQEATANMVKSHMWSEGEFNQAELDRMASGLRLVGEVNGPVDFASMIDTAYLPADLQGVH